MEHSEIKTEWQLSKRTVSQIEHSHKKKKLVKGERFHYTFKLVMEWVALLDFVTDLQVTCQLW